MYFPAGQFALSHFLTLNKSNRTFVGHSAADSIIIAPSLSGLEGTSAVDQSPAFKLFRVAVNVPLVQIEISSLQFRGPAIAGFDGPYTNVHIRENRFTGTYTSGGDYPNAITFTEFISSSSIERNDFRDLGGTLFAGISTYEIQAFEISDNTFENVGQGIKIASNANGATGVKVNNNRFSGIMEKPIEIQDSNQGPNDTNTAFNGLQVNYNVISDFQPGAGGVFSDGCFGISVAANLATNTVIEGNKLFGKLVPTFVRGTIPILGIEVAVNGGSVKNNLVEGFGEPISEWAYGPITLDSNRLRGVYDPSLTPNQGVLQHIAPPILINHNASMTVETALLVGPDLIVRGTANADTVNLSTSGSNVRVQLAGYDQTFSPTGGLLVYGDSGNDSITVASSLTRSATLVGAAGDDTLQGGGGATTITGNAGADTLIFDDSANTTATTYTLTNTSIARQGGPSAAYRSIERVIFRPGTGTIVTTSAQRLAALEIAADRTVTVEQNATWNDPTGVLTVESLSIASGGVLDLTNNSMIIDYTGSVGMLVNDVRQHLQAGRMVTSSGVSQQRGIGYADNAVLSPVKTTFAGQDVDESSILIKFTYFGDANLDGKVDVADLGALASNWQTSAPWTGGDFDYSGFVDVADLGLLASNWQAGVEFPSDETFNEAWNRLRHGGRAGPDSEPEEDAYESIAAELGLSAEQLAAVLAVWGANAGGPTL